MSLKCVECGNDDQTRLSMQVDRGGRMVRFRVDCDRCGVFSHYLEHSEVNRAAKGWCNKAAKSVAILLAILHKPDLWPMLDAEEKRAVVEVEQFFQGRK